MDLVQKHANIVGSAGFFCACSAGMLIFNKMLMNQVSTPMFVVSFQMLFAVATVGAVVLGQSLLGKKAHFRGGWRDVARWSIVSLFFPAMLGTSMLALQYTTMTCVVVFRNISPLGSLVAERFFPNPVPIDRDTVLSLLVVLSGVVLYAVKDLHFTWVGVAWTVANMLVAVLERLLNRYFLHDAPVDISRLGLILLNNGLGLPIAVAMMFFMGEGTKVLQIPTTAIAAASPWMILACLAGVLIAYSALRLQQLVTATTVLVLINVNKIGVIMLEVLFMGKHSSPLALAGCFITVGGGILYSAARTRVEDRQQQLNKAQSDDAAALETGDAEESSEKLPLKAAAH